MTDRDIMAMDFNAILRTGSGGVRIERSQRLYDRMKTTLEELSQEKTQIATELEREKHRSNLSSDAKQYLYDSGAVIRVIEDTRRNVEFSNVSQDQLSSAQSCLRSRYEPNVVGELTEFVAVAAVGGAGLRLGLRALSAVSRSIQMNRTSAVFSRLTTSRLASGALGYGAYLTRDLAE